MKLNDAFFLFIMNCLSVNGYRILGIFPLNAKSHFMMYGELMKGLARKGHQVDVISALPLKEFMPNYRDVFIFPPVIQGLVNNLTYDDIKYYNAKSSISFIAEVAGNQLCTGIQKPEFQNFLKSHLRSTSYDAIIVEIFGADCFLSIGTLWNVPVIGASSAVLYPWMHDMIANPENIAFISNNLINYMEKLDFLTRIYNFLSATFNKIYFDHLTTSFQDDVIKRYLGLDAPGIREARKNVAMILANSHFSLNGVRSFTPALIEIGGLHIQEDSDELSQELKKWLDESKSGVVYFSFGSMVKIESFPRDVIDVFYKSLRKITPVRVLMKIVKREELPDGLPDNVHVLPWVPQMDVLKHPNVRLFITHGGLMGTQEAIHCGVPMIGIPLFADQFTNVDLYVAKKIAVRLNIHDIKEKDLDDALNVVLNYPSYRETAKRISTIFRDRPMRPIDTAAYWIEYIIRNGKDSLRSPATSMSWWQVALLDVYGFLVLSLIILLWFVVKLTVKIIFSAKVRASVLEKKMK